MIRLNADETPLEILTGFYEPVELYDATGTRVIGHFTPADPERCQRVLAQAVARTDREKLARRAVDPGPLQPVSEFLAELEIRYPINAVPESPTTDSTTLPGSSECVAP